MGRAYSQYCRLPLPLDDQHVELDASLPVSLRPIPGDRQPLGIENICRAAAHIFYVLKIARSHPPPPNRRQIWWDAERQIL